MNTYCPVRPKKVLIPTLSFVLSIGGVHAQTPVRYSGDISPTFGAVNDTCAFEITLWDATSDGTRIGPVNERELPVRDGRYATELDFGAEATGEDSRYLQVAVGCPAGTAGMTTLTRRAFHPASAQRMDRGNQATGEGAPPKAALGTAFTYQGELQESGAPVTGSGDFQFSLWDAASGGAQIGATVPVNGVAVADGRFTASLDFGAAAFDGDARWLEIAVDYPSGGGSMITLSPRQPLSAAPYALQTRGIFVDDSGNVGIGTDTPADPFHVVGSTTIDGALRMHSGQGVQFPDLSNRIYTDVGKLRFESDGDMHFSSTSGGMRYSSSYDFNVDSGTFVVDPAMHRVGIGTSDPTALLHVAGHSLFTGDMTLDSGAGSTLRVYGSMLLTETLQMSDGSWIGTGWTSEKIWFDAINNEIEFHKAEVGIGTMAPTEMLHVENSDADGRAFLKLQASHPTEWNETGLRWETPQNRWHLRMDDHDNGNIPEGALGLRCNTPGHEIMTWTEGGMVGIGNTNPSAKLDVVGDLELSGAYRGSIGPNNGAPFPRPAYDSGWVAIGQGESVDLSHGIGGDRDDYVVDLQLYGGGPLGVHNILVGGDHDGSAVKGVSWRRLNESLIFVVREPDDTSTEEFRVRIWVVN